MSAHACPDLDAGLRRVLVGRCGDAPLVRVACGCGEVAAWSLAGDVAVGGRLNVDAATSEFEHTLWVDWLLESLVPQWEPHARDVVLHRSMRGEPPIRRVSNQCPPAPLL